MVIEYNAMPALSKLKLTLPVQSMKARWRDGYMSHQSAHLQSVSSRNIPAATLDYLTSITLT